jgi:desulfoferrodoxin (superoxide reductase-like protein)
MSLKILFKKLKEITMYRNIVFQNWAIAHPQRDHNSIQWVALLAIVYISRKNVNNPYGVFVLKKINRKKNYENQLINIDLIYHSSRKIDHLKYVIFKSPLNYCRRL